MLALINSKAGTVPLTPARRDLLAAATSMHNLSASHHGPAGRLLMMNGRLMADRPPGRSMTACVRPYRGPAAGPAGRRVMES